jgi:hypothetical protein
MQHPRNRVNTSCSECRKEGRKECIRREGFLDGAERLWRRIRRKRKEGRKGRVGRKEGRKEQVPCTERHASPTANNRTRFHYLYLVHNWEHLYRRYGDTCMVPSPEGGRKK